MFFTQRTKRYDFYHLLLIFHMDIFSDHSFNLFKSDIGTRHQFEYCGIWLEFGKFSIDAQ